MIPYKNPLAYKQLRTWQQANEILDLTEEYIKTLPQKEPARSHMDRSARSTVRNIEEGFRRTTTNEYISFLGFSAGSNEELMADFEHCIKGKVGDQERAEKGFWLCKGEAKMLFNQIKALEQKTIREKTLTGNDLARIELKRRSDKEKEFDKYLENFLKDNKKDKLS
ncbi:MAG: four helix bundle protein [Patescibacteria group bacterium]